jgi:uncharacterized protein (DUF2147 family)
MRWIIGLSAVAVMVSLAAYAVTETDIVAQWTVADGKSRVEIYKAVDGSIEGKIVWLSAPNYPDGDAEAGKPKHDRENPDKSMQNRPIVGLVLLKGFKFDGKKEWSGGTVYDPESGKTYKGKLWLDNENTLGMRGFIGISLLGRTEKWTRYAEEKK